MAEQNKILEHIKESKIIAIVRGIPSTSIVDLVEAMVKGGVSCVEVTFDQSSEEKSKDSLKAISLIRETFGDRVGETAAAGEDSAEVGGVVEDAFVEGGYVDVAAVEERLEFFKCHSRVDIWLHGVLLDFEFLGGAWAYEDYAAGAFVFFDVF